MCLTQTQEGWWSGFANAIFYAALSFEILGLDLVGSWEIGDGTGAPRLEAHPNYNVGLRLGPGGGVSRPTPSAFIILKAKRGVSVPPQFLPYIGVPPRFRLGTAFQRVPIFTPLRRYRLGTASVPPWRRLSFYGVPGGTAFEPPPFLHRPERYRLGAASGFVAACLSFYGDPGGTAWVPLEENGIRKTGPRPSCV